MAAVFSNSTKLMLRNVIRHTNSHNKTVEEAEMWQQYERQKELGGLDPSNPSYGHDDRCSSRNDRDRRRNDYWNSRSEKRAYLSTSYPSRRAHMDDEDDKAKSGSSTSTFWMRQLEKLESSDPNRWDHSGYRELYPNDFRSDRSDSESPRPLSHHHKKKFRKSKTKKKKEHRSRSKNRKDKRLSHRRRKKVRRRQPSSSSSESDSDFESSSNASSSLHRKPQHITKRFHDNRNKSRRYTDGSSSSYTDSDSDSSLRRQKRRRRVSGSPVPKKRRYDKTKSCRYTTPNSSSGTYSDSDWDSDSRECSPAHKQKQTKRTRESSVSMSSVDRCARVSSAERKKVKRGKLGHTKRTKTKKQSKHKRKGSGKAGLSKHAGRAEEENQADVKMWKDMNGHAMSTDSDFDRRLRKEIPPQCHGLKREHTQKGANQDAKMNGSSSLASNKRRRYSSSSYSSDSD